MLLSFQALSIRIAKLLLQWRINMSIHPSIIYIPFKFKVVLVSHSVGWAAPGYVEQ